MQNRPVLCSYFCAHVDGLQRYLARRVTAPDEVEDVAQEVFLRLTAVELPRLENPRAFLLAAARNVLRDRHRRRSARGGVRHVALDDLDLASQEASPGELVEGREQLRFFEEAVYALPEDQRHAFLRFYFGEHSQEEIAVEMSRSLSGVEKLLRAARLGVRGQLEKRERRAPVPA